MSHLSIRPSFLSANCSESKAHFPAAVTDFGWRVWTFKRGYFWVCQLLMVYAGQQLTADFAVAVSQGVQGVPDVKNVNKLKTNSKREMSPTSEVL